MSDPLAGLPPGFDAYKTLQVDPEADPEVVQAAYRRLARKFHPDVAGSGSAERMAAINTAWELVRDPERRAAYDRARAGSGPRDAPGAHASSAHSPAASSGWGSNAPFAAGSAPAQPGTGGPDPVPPVPGRPDAPSRHGASGARDTGPSRGVPRPSAGGPGESISADWTSGRSTIGGGYDPATMRRADGEGAAGPPPGHPSGSVLNFGRYAGWSLGEIGRVDAEYLEWLDRAPIGRPYRDELDVLLRRLGRRRSARSQPPDPRRGTRP